MPVPLIIALIVIAASAGALFWQYWRAADVARRTAEASGLDLYVMLDYDMSGVHILAFDDLDGGEVLDMFVRAPGSNFPDVSMLTVEISARRYLQLFCPNASIKET